MTRRLLRWRDAALDVVVLLLALAGADRAADDLYDAIRRHRAR